MGYYERAASLNMLEYFRNIVADYYVSTSGNDSNDGSYSAPFLTIQHAVDTAVAGETVAIREGTYDETLTLGTSGTSGSPITIKKYTSDVNNPVLGGLVDVTDWTDLGGNIWESTSAVSTLSSLAFVAFNGVNKAMGKLPQNGYYTIDSHSGATEITSSDLDGVTDWTGAVAVTRNKHWIINKQAITATSGTTITTDTSQTYDYTDNYGFFIQDDVRTLTYQDAWYYNPTTKKLRIYSTTEPSNIQIPNKTNLLTANGVDYVTIDGIDFAGANGSAVSLTATKNISILNSNFDFCYEGIRGNNNSSHTDLESENLLVSYCNFEDMINNAVWIDSEFQNFTLSHNYVNGSGELAGAGGSGDGNYNAFRTMGSGALISYNELRNIGYNPISFSGDNSVVTKNLIDTYNFIKDDGAGIYTADPFSGRQITYNIVLNGIGADGANPPYNTPAAVEGIYLDNLSNDVLIQYNTVVNVPNASIFLHRNSGDNNIQYNTFYDAKGWNGMINFQSEDTVAQSGNTFSNNLVISATAARRVLRAESPFNDLTSIGTFDNNTYANIVDGAALFNYNQPSTGTTDTDLAGWKSFMGIDAASTDALIIEDPLNVQVEYNASDVASIVTLGSNMRDLLGNSYPAGDITIPAWGSKILIPEITYGANKVTNGTFDTDSDWSVSGSMTQVISGGVWQGSGASGYSYSLEFNLDAGTYEFSIDHSATVSYSYTFSVNQRFGSYASVMSESVTDTALTTSVFQFTVTTGGNHRVQLNPQNVASNGGTVTCDNILLREIL